MMKERKATIKGILLIISFVCFICASCICARFVIDKMFDLLGTPINDGVLYVLTDDGPLAADNDIKYEKGNVIAETGYTDKMYQLFGPEVIYSKEVLKVIGDVVYSKVISLALNELVDIAKENDSYDITINNITRRDNNYTISYKVKDMYGLYNVVIE